MNQKDLIKYGLLALGAYLIYRYVQEHGGIEKVLGSMRTGTESGVCPTGQILTAVTDDTGRSGYVCAPPKAPKGPGPTPIIPTPTAQHPVAQPITYAPPAPVANIKDRVLHQATVALQGSRGTPPNLNLNEWCYYFGQVTGQSCPNPGDAWPSIDPSSEIDIDTWWGLMGPWLSANMPNLAGLGLFTPLLTPYWLN